MIYLFKLNCVKKTVQCCVLPALERGERTAFLCCGVDWSTVRGLLSVPAVLWPGQAPLASHCVGISAQSLLRHGAGQTGWCRLATLHCLLSADSPSGLALLRPTSRHFQTSFNFLSVLS